jgi:SPP1 gp7 family putative phage head morphogenesis protein
MNSSAFVSAIASGLTQDRVTTPTHDVWQSKKQRARAQQHWQKVRNAELGYARQLRKIARHVGEIIKHFAIGDPAVVPEVTNILQRYASVITPWAKATAARMIAEVDRRDMTAWQRHAREMSRALHKEVAQAPIGEVVRQLQNDQVHLITSIPLDAAMRVQELTQQYVLGGRRYDELAEMIANTTGVTMSRATLIARTETAKAAASLVQARAQYVGSTHYIWHSVQDIYVRKMHRHLNGTTQEWANPPIAEENGVRHHPGNFPNCRCYAEPVIGDII